MTKSWEEKRTFELLARRLFPMLVIYMQSGELLGAVQFLKPVVDTYYVQNLVVGGGKTQR